MIIPSHHPILIVTSFYIMLSLANPSHPIVQWVPSPAPRIFPMRPTCSSKPHSNIRSASSSTSKVTRSKVTSPWDADWGPMGSHGWWNHGENGWENGEMGDFYDMNGWEMLGKWLENRSNLAGKITKHGGKSMETWRIYHRCCRWI